jgi:hypothetical protein
MACALGPGAGLPQYSNGRYDGTQHDAERPGRKIWKGSYVEPWLYRACIRANVKPAAFRMTQTRIPKASEHAAFILNLTGGSERRLFAISQPIEGTIVEAYLRRRGISGVFAVPAAIAGYHVVLAMSQIGVHLPAWREVLACVGSILIGGTAWTRLAVFAEPHPLEPGGMADSTSQPVLTAATREG